MLAYSLNRIERLEDGKAVSVLSGNVFPCNSQKEYDSLLALGAIRPASAAETALYNVANPAANPAPEPEQAPEPVQESKGKGKAKADPVPEPVVDETESLID